MLLTHAAMGWTVLMLTLLRLCRPVMSGAVKVFQPYKASSSNGTARVRGFHGDQEVCSTILHLPERRDTELEEEQVKCSARESEGAVVVTVSGLRAEDTDVYRCEIQILYPPPYLRLRGNGTLVHVSGQDDCGCPAKGPQREGPQREGALRGDEGEEGKEPVSAAVVVLVVLVTFVLVIIIFFQTLQCERVRRDAVTLTSAGRC
ncbi:putative cytotoxic T-lymphocyte protein 4-like [Scophthalmus maximus]|uniref:Putative cytotoxic T-lymphocyte protein 4-like n=1 Tax=Scophthalmus maximus TaxID=52904 RepID=A0A2U9CAP9_SCOMX|nr:putative cytotoxic T-lymphocyte protein 4-like [Scophthalmus maximus]